VAAPEPGPGDDWERIVDAVRRVRPTLGTVLAEAVVVERAEGRLTVALPGANAFRQDQLKNAANRDLLVSTARRVCPDVRDVVVAAAPPAGARDPIVEHPVVRAAIDLFGGEVTLVRPAGREPAPPPPAESEEEA
jgi:hypothetical protein